MSIVLFNSEVDGPTTLSIIILAAFTRDPYMLGVLNPSASLTGGTELDIVLGGSATLLILRLANILLSRPHVVWVTVCMPLRWVYPWTWRSVLPVSWLVVYFDACIRFPLRRW